MESSTHPRRRLDSALHAYLGLMCITTCCFALEYAPQPMYNTISATYGTGRGLTGLVVGVYMLSLSISPLFVGLLLNSMGIRRGILTAGFLLGLTGIGIWYADSFHTLMAVRTVQALLAPVVLTAVMTAISSLFRHLDLSRALAGYVTVNLLGSLTGRFGGGVGAEFFGWKETLVFFCALFFLTLPAIWRLPDIRRPEGRKASRPRLHDYLTILRQPGVPSLVLAEACFLCVFAAVGNLLPFRMAELGKGDSNSLVGLMYAGYAVGLLAGLIVTPLKRLFKTSARVLVFGALVYLVSALSLASSSLGVVFAGIWGMAFGQFVVHAMSPGLVNSLATHAGQVDRAMVNGLYLSCFYLGGLLGTYLPGLVYEHFGWTVTYICLQTLLCFTFGLVWRLAVKMPDLH